MNYTRIPIQSSIQYARYVYQLYYLLNLGKKKNKNYINIYLCILFSYTKVGIPICMYIYRHKRRYRTVEDEKNVL